MCWSAVLGLLEVVLGLILEGDSLSCLVKTFPTGFTRLHRSLPWWWWWWPSWPCRWHFQDHTSLDLPSWPKHKPSCLWKVWQIVSSQRNTQETVSYFNVVRQKALDLLTRALLFFQVLKSFQKWVFHILCCECRVGFAWPRMRVGHLSTCANPTLQTFRCGRSRSRRRRRRRRRRRADFRQLGHKGYLSTVDAAWVRDERAGQRRQIEVRFSLFEDWVHRELWSGFFATQRPMCCTCLNASYAATTYMSQLPVSIYFNI